MCLLIIGGLAIAAIIAAGIARFVGRHGLPVLLWRWFSGNPLSGVVYTNATWFQPADKVMHSSGRVHPWHHLPRFKRAITRTITTLGTFATVYGVIVARFLVECIAAVMLSGGIAYGIYRGRVWHNDRVLITPLSAALAGILDLTVAQTAKSITLPNRFGPSMTGDIGAITLPSRFRASPEQRKATEHLVRSRLPVDVDFSWKTSRNPQVLGILAAPKPPDMVRFQDHIALMEACAPGDILIGLDRHATPYYGSFNQENPHWGFSVGSGRGKSTFLLMTTAQVLHNDARATVDAIDPKMSSLNPLVGIPGVTIARDPMNIPEMWDVIGRFKNTMLSRLKTQETDPTAEFPIKLLVIDEINSFASMSSKHWKGLPKAERASGSIPAVWDDIAFILWMGRQAKCYMIVVGQRLDDKATGSCGLRDSLGFRGLAGYRKNQWEMLVGGPMPRSQKPRGRWIYSDGESESWIQNLYAKPEIIRDYATARRTMQPVPGKVSA